MALDLDYFKKKLEEEKTRLEGELGTIAHRNPDAPEDWAVSQPDMNVMPAAKEEVADVGGLKTRTFIFWPESLSFFKKI